MGSASTGNADRNLSAQKRPGIVKRAIRLFALAVLVFAAAVWLSDTMKRPSGPLTAHIKGPAIGCADRDDLRRLEHYSEQGDMEAWHQLSKELRNAHRCVLLEDGEKVLIQNLASSDLGHREVRRPSETMVYWTLSEWAPID